MCLLTSHEFLFFSIKQKSHHSLGADIYPKEPGGLDILHDRRQGFGLLEAEA